MYASCTKPSRASRSSQIAISSSIRVISESVRGSEPSRSSHQTQAHLIQIKRLEVEIWMSTLTPKAQMTDQQLGCGVQSCMRSSRASLSRLSNEQSFLGVATSPSRSKSFPSSGRHEGTNQGEEGDQADHNQSHRDQRRWYGLPLSHVICCVFRGILAHLSSSYTRAVIIGFYHLILCNNHSREIGISCQFICQSCSSRRISSHWRNVNNIISSITSE